MAFLGCSCKKEAKSNGLSGKGKIRARTTVLLANSAVLKGTSDIKERVSKDHATRNVTTFSGVGALSGKTSTASAVQTINTLKGVGSLVSNMSFAGIAIKTVNRLKGIGSISNSYVDKFAGDFDAMPSGFNATQKLYPIADIENNGFVNQDIDNVDIYQSVDEGVYTGNIIDGDSTIVADETTWVQPSSINTIGEYSYKTEVTAPLITPNESFLIIRASAPTSDNQSLKSPIYTLYNIQLTDPNGDVIAKYNDIVVQGDNQYVTYASAPSLNNVTHEWHPDFPLLGESSNYVLNLDLAVDCDDDPFDEGYQEDAYQDTCESNTPPSTINPSIQISAIEISNSGSLVGLRSENYLGFYGEVSAIGDRLTRRIYPSTILDSEFNSTVWPEITGSIWESSTTLSGLSGENTNPSGIQVINSLTGYNGKGSIKLVDEGTIPGSGKLNMVFSHTPPPDTAGVAGGAFAGYFPLDFDTANYRVIEGVDNWFKVDEVSLVLKARKSDNSVRDFALDIVGFSDDKILNVTPAVGGFLQNTDGDGTVPAVSGFKGIDDLGISTVPVSDKSQYFQQPATNNPGGDHYKLTTVPVVDSTTWTEYTIPLAIYEDTTVLGKPTDYSMASYFEKLYLDIFPLPQGAELSDIKLVVTYAPQNALMMHSMGHSDKTLRIGDTPTWSPSAMKSSDDYINSNIDVQPLSLIEDIPQGYSSPDTIKTNLSRRWRGSTTDILIGPFDPDQFDLSFEYREALNPFSTVYFDFSYTDGNTVLSTHFADTSLPVAASLFGGATLDDNLIKNEGLRFNSSKYFPTSQRLYKSIDFCEAGHPLEGKISDAYNNALVIENGANLQVPAITGIENGFAAFVRFSPHPDTPTTGVMHIVNSANSTEGWRISINNNRLRGQLRDINGVQRTVNDTVLLTEYSFPLSVLLTYNNNTLTLYTDNEIADKNWDIKRASVNVVDGAAPSTRTTRFNTSSVITEFGYSIPCNLVDSYDDITSKNDRETTVNRFFEAIRAKYWQNGQDYTDDRYSLWKFVDDRLTDWYIGAFNYEQFGPAFDQYTTRGSEDFLTHHLVSSGLPYGDKTDIALPSDMDLTDITYHSQIENDMLRFNISPVNDDVERMYAVAPRINKAIPRDYKFEENALIVKTVVEHKSDVDILWPWDGYVGEQNYGPKIIVSLYARSKDPLTYEAKNHGLVLRKPHYIHPINDSLIQLNTTFTYDELISQGETWAEFDTDISPSEGGEKWFPVDIETMFVQYDIAYPSGTPFDSELRMHTVHIGSEAALMSAGDRDSAMNLVGSGGFYQFDSIPLDIEGIIPESGIINFATSGTPIPTDSGILHMQIENRIETLSSMIMYTETVNEITAPHLSLVIERIVKPVPPQDMNLTLSGSEVPFNASLGFFSQGDPIYAKAEPILNLVTRGSEATTTLIDNSINLVMLGAPAPSLFDERMNLYIDSTVPLNQSDDYVNMMTWNVLAIDPDLDQQVTIDWNGTNCGERITITDQLNGKVFLPLDDEIRGVITTCSCDCVADGTCVQEDISTHCSTWYESTCVDGGVISARRTYTNPDSSGFLTPVAYDKNFYGLRKYTGLVPYGTYSITITGKTASDDIINVPREITEWEYGTNDEVSYSGIKLSGDDPVSDSGRQAGDNYGQAVDIVGDLMAVGSPKHDIQDSTGYNLENAGTVFVYRRQQQPSGATFDYHKAGWDLEAELKLPEGYERDSYIEQDDEFNFEGVRFTGTRRFWSVGQEGRQLGHSVAAYQGDDKELIVVGAPDAKFSRTFPELNPEPVNVALFVMTNEFIPEIPYKDARGATKYRTYNDVLGNIKGKDALFTYFADPSTQFNVQFIILEPMTPYAEDTPPFPAPEPDFITKSTIDRHVTYDRLTPEFQTQDDLILQQMKDAYHARFPLQAGALHSGIPPILGIYVDVSASLGERAVQPATDRFISYWQNWTFENGLKDFDSVPASGYAEYLTSVDEDWVTQSNKIIDKVLSTGNMIQEDYFDLFANKVGPEAFQSEVESANQVPPSGGAVFVFENYNGEWTPIQRIDSPTELSTIKPDRYGHALDISKDGSTVIVGSPYINEAVQVWDRNLEATQESYDRILSWINSQTSTYYARLRETWRDVEAMSGEYVANEATYLEMNASGKYAYRTEYQIDEFTKKFTYTYSDDKIFTNWGWMAEEFVPTSRLGYSVAVNESGTLIAAGQPTHSMNLQNNFNVYWRPGKTPESDWWHSYVNAGAVKVWDSRAFYPHNKAVEFTRFGNLFEIRNKDDMAFGTFDHFQDIYNLSGQEWEKLPFEEVNIPQDAGLAFLITPAEDALSEEIITNIQEWLALGDRHLVIVANDPQFEDGGAYTNSTAIANQLLRELDSRMVVLPPKTEYESCISGVPFELNAVPSFRPAYSQEPIGRSSNLVGSGYGDIKLYMPGVDVGYDCSEAGKEEFRDPLSNDINAPKYWEINDKCEMFQLHLGDLRAQWNDICIDFRGEPVVYIENIGKTFGTWFPGQCDPSIMSRSTLMPFGEPTPLIAAGEDPPPRDVLYPAVPEQINESWQLVGYRLENGGQVFAEESLDEPTFVWAYNSGEDLAFTSNLGNTGSKSRWYDPEFYNDKDGMLQAKADTKIETARYPVVATNNTVVIAEEAFGNRINSSVVLVSMLSSESTLALDGGFGDKNQNMYANLVAKDNNGSSKIAQLNGSTGRDRFTSGYYKSSLFDVFLRNGNEVVSDVPFEDLSLSQNNYNVAWIANSLDVLTDQEIDILKEWLDTGGKKLVITYGADPSITTPQTNRQASLVSANVAGSICSGLGLTMKPLFLPGKNRLAKLRRLDGDTGTNSQYPDWGFSNSAGSAYVTALRLNESSYISRGYPGLVDSSIRQFNFTTSPVDDLVPIDVGDNGTVLGYFTPNILDDNFTNIGIPELKTGVAKLEINGLIPGSGYRIYTTFASESLQEVTRVNMQFADVFPNVPPADQRELPPNATYSIKDVDNETNELIDIEQVKLLNPAVIGDDKFEKVADGRPFTYVRDFLIPDNASGISIYIDANKVDYSKPPIDKPYPPIYTPRVLAVSGALIDLVTVTEEVPVYEKVIEVIPAVPERFVSVDEGLRQISHGSSQYCPESSDIPEEQCSGYFADQSGEDPLIADGPVIVAQETYFQKPFDAGAERSRITVISDPSLIEGESILTEQGSIRPQLADFLRSLYPDSPPEDAGEKTYNQSERIISTERTSPQKLFANTGNEGLVQRFQGTGTPASGMPLTEFTDIEFPAIGRKYQVLQLPDGEPSTYTTPRQEPILGGDQQIEGEKRTQIAAFENKQYLYGGTSKFSGIYENELYQDASYLGGMPSIMTDHDVDYLDFKAFPSGYPGDLFGYSISLFNNKLLIGAPFVAWESEQKTSWAEAASGSDYLSGSLSGAIIGNNGGAGAAYLYELGVGSGVDTLGNPTRWKQTRKFRPSGINTGQDLTDSVESQANKYLGLNAYTDAELEQWSTKSDMFGYDVDIECDLLVISAPGHDFNNAQTITAGAFQRKSFNGAFDIQSVINTDLGASGVRDELGSGTAILNNGAIYSYQNNITDWGGKGMEWQMLQKVTAQGYKSAEAGESENMFFGEAVSLDRSRRSDGDYTMAVGVPHEQYGTSGVALEDAGAAYTYDAMLRLLPPSVADSGSWIYATVYGDKPLNPDASTVIYFENGTERSARRQAFGFVTADSDGQIFIEASGQDLVQKGYVEHRPFIESVQGFLLQGEQEFNNLRLAVSGGGPDAEDDLNLYINSDGGTVYNNIGLYASAVLGAPSGEMNLVTWNPSGIPVTSTVNMVASGAGFNQDIMTLRVRGK